MIPCVRIAVIGGVVEVGIAPTEVGMYLGHVAGDQIGPGHHVDRQALGGDEELVVGGDDAAGEVAGIGDDAGASGPEESVRHLADDALHPVGEDGKLHTIDAGLLAVR